MLANTNSELFLSFIFLLFLAGLTSYYAKRKGRNPTTWFVLGLFFGFFALLVLFFLAPVVKKEGEDDGYPTMSISNPDPSLLSSPDLSPTFTTPDEDKLWYYLDMNHEQMGPVSVIALRELWNRGQLELNSYVWSNGMEKWEKVDSLADLKDVLNK